MVASPVLVVCRVGVTGERVEVLFVDFGNVDVVSVTALKALPPQLMMLPMQVSDLRVCACAAGNTACVSLHVYCACVSLLGHPLPS